MREVTSSRPIISALFLLRLFEEQVYLVLVLLVHQFQAVNGGKPTASTPFKRTGDRNMNLDLKDGRCFSAGCR